MVMDATTADRPAGLPAFEAIAEDFTFLDDWEDRYRFLIELGRALGEFPENERSAENKVQGCASQVWIATRRDRDSQGVPLMSFRGDSDALIVRGLIALLIALLSGRPAREIAAMDALGALRPLGLEEHLTPQRSNGLASMVKRLKAEAVKAAA
jgi:cysteine desulfuration protein SufE